MRCSLIVLAMALTVCISSISASAQTNKLPGKVTEENGDPIIGASIRFKNKKTGVITKDDGSFSIPSTGQGTLIISALGFTEQEINVSGLSEVSVKLAKSNKELDEVVVTAMGIRRAKNTLPYAAQQISGDEANKVRVTNIAGGLSGKVSGLEIRQNNSVGGSVNVIIRGIKSLTNNNQALFVVDGSPMDNTIRVSGGSTSGGLGSGGGYDMGNTASDINPDDIQSINVLKGAAATALYGSRGANGVIMITTKKGGHGSSNVTANAGMTLGQIDKSTFVKRQNQYGAGRSDNLATGGFISKDITGDGIPDLIVNTNAPRSWGPKFDKNIMVYQWDAFDPLSPNFHKATPWVAPKHGPEYFFKTAITNNESVFLDGTSEKGTYKLGFSRINENGTIPNSSDGRNTINFGATHKVTDRITLSATANYVQETAVGRNGTGYDGTRNPNTQFRQYGEVNVDYKEQKDAYFRSQKNVTWNWSDPTTTAGLVPFSYNNPWFTAYQDFENDSRNRTYGNVALNYQILDWLNLMGRVSLDTYDQAQEERVAVTSIGTPSYSRFNSFFRELNYDLIATVNKDINPNLKFNGLLGVNMRRDNITSISQSTTGGLIIPNLYAISNSVGAISAPGESSTPKAVDGYFAGATFTYRDFLSLDGSFRRDRSSTLPVDVNGYNYYSVSGSWQFYEQLKDKFSWLSSGKLRANYATVGNDAPWGSIQDVYNQGNPFVAGTTSSILFSLPTTKNNDALKPERTNSKEVGLEMSFLKNRIGIDASYYHTNTVDQILGVTTSAATGYGQKFVNAGNLQNQGFEVSVFASPVKTRNFSWDINVNWTRNRSKLLSLNNGATNLSLGTYQASISVNATVGQPYGQIFGQTYQFLKGQHVVSNDGSAYLLSTTTTNVLGNFNPDWIGGVTNTFHYKSFNLSFLVDVRKGGTVWSLDQYYGQMSGILPSSVGLNDLGNDKRLPVAQGGGIILKGVNASGATNTIRTTITSGNSTLLPPPDFAYDASYVKLRELSFGYHIPGSKLGAAGKRIKGMDIQLLGRNLWLIHKNLPMADPEDGASAGNNQGLQFGSYPTVRSLGLNLKMQF